MTYYDLSHMAVMDPEQLKTCIDEHIRMRLQPGQHSSIGPCVLVRTLTPVLLHDPEKPAGLLSEHNTLAVILPVEAYQKMRYACDAISLLFSAMEKLGELESYAHTWDIPA